jgi:hypothetical protein
LRVLGGAQIYSNSKEMVRQMEKALADEIAAIGYNVFNTVNCRMKLNEAKFAPVRAAFAKHFKNLKSM